MKRTLLGIIEDLIRGISGGLGRRIRRAYYRRRLARCGTQLDVAPGVRFVRPEYIEVGDNVAIDFHCVLLAGPMPEGTAQRRLRGDADRSIEGRIIIGSNSHIGIGTVIQGHGGVALGEGFTSSAYCTLYSFSNDPYTCHHGTMDSAAGKASYVSGAVRCGRNVWLGLQVSLVSCALGQDVFVRPHTLVHRDMPDNAVVGGTPAAVVDQRFNNPS